MTDLETLEHFLHECLVTMPENWDVQISNNIEHLDSHSVTLWLLHGTQTAMERLLIGQTICSKWNLRANYIQLLRQS